MNDERYISRLVGSARFHLRQKLDDEAGSLPCIEIPYTKREFYKIKELFDQIQKYAEANNLTVSFVSDGTQHLRWEYKFKMSIFLSNE